MPPKKQVDPDRLIRESPGRYHTPDERFVVEQESSGNWYLADAEHTDELGLPLLRGPFPTLAGAREAVAAARSSAAPSPKRKARPTTGGRPTRGQRPTTAPAGTRDASEAPKVWPDTLPAADRTEARQLIQALERLGLPDAPRLARREQESSKPVVARELLLRALEARAEEDPLTPEAALDVVFGEGFSKDRGRPPRGWRLVELDDRGRPTERTIERG